MINKISIFLVLFTSLLCCLVEMPNEVIGNSLTCLSIIFGFSISYLCSVYNHQDFNNVLKINNQLPTFLKDNKKFLINMITGIGIIFLIGLIKNYSYIYSLKIYKTDIIISLHIQLYLLVALITILLFYCSYKFISDFIVVYKNSYSNYLSQKVSKK